MRALAVSRRLLLGLAAGLVVVAAAVVLVLVNRDGRVDGSAVPVPPRTSTPEQPCSNEVVVFVNTDEEMRQAADRLRADPRVEQLTTETKQQAYERFKVVFKDQPELVDIARPEALPASVRVTPVPGKITTSELARQLQAEFPGADKVQSFLPC